MSGYHAIAGDSVAELGDTDDPTDLIPGDPEAVDKSLSGMRKLGFGMSRAAEGLAGTEASHWEGAAGDAFRARFAGKPQQWADAGNAFWDVGEALINYRDVLRTAQKDAAQAIAWHAEAEAATEKATEEYNAAAERYNDALAAGEDPGPRPQWNDPGKELRAKAENLLNDARTRVTDAGYECGQVISGWVGRMPAEPDAWDKFWMDAGDTVDFLATQTADMATGAAQALGEMIKFSRSINPLDPYNITHPSVYLDNMQKLATGITHAASHPRETILAIADVETWRDSPGKALGKLVPDVVLGAVTGGTALAGRTAGRTVAAAAREGVEDAGTLGRNAAESVGRQVADTSTKLGGFDRGLFERLGAEAYSRLQPFPQPPPPGVVLGKVDTPTPGLGTPRPDVPSASTQAPPAPVHRPEPPAPRIEPQTQPVPVHRPEPPPMRHEVPEPPAARPEPPAARVDPQTDRVPVQRPDPLPEPRPDVPETPPARSDPPATRPEPSPEVRPEPSPEPAPPRDPEPSPREPDAPEREPDAPEREPESREPELTDEQKRIQADLEANGVDFPLDQLPEGAVWRESREFLYRVDDRGDDEIWTEGFKPKDPTNTDLHDYVSTNKESAFVSTSRSQDIWMHQADRNYMYVLDAKGGIEVNKTVPQHEFQGQNEIALPYGAGGHIVVGRYRLYTDPVTGRRELDSDFELNPYR